MGACGLERVAVGITSIEKIQRRTRFNTRELKALKLLHKPLLAILTNNVLAEEDYLEEIWNTTSGELMSRDSRRKAVNIVAQADFGKTKMKFTVESNIGENISCEEEIESSESVQ